MTPADLADLYRDAHNRMRNLDGLQPQDAFDELLKYLFFRQVGERRGDRVELGATANERRSLRANEAGVARSIRKLFMSYLMAHEGEIAWQLWRTRPFQLSDAALVGIHEILADVPFTEISVDIRAAALRAFVAPELRRGLGIYLTPDEVVRAAVEVVRPEPRMVVLDPACGSGTFLIETLRSWSGSKRATVHAIDVNARMLLLAELNLAHERGVTLRSSVLDALSTQAEKWLPPESVDVIFTNPPFGVYIDAAAVDRTRFATLGDRTGARSVQSEILFVEQCLRWLKPGGRLCIVVPRSVVTNLGLGCAREVIDAIATLEGVINLPPETFSTSGTTATTSVLFFRKARAGALAPDKTKVAVVDVTNVGYDHTGRPRDGSQLLQAAKDLRRAIERRCSVGLARMVEAQGSGLAGLTGAAQRGRRRPARTLRDVVVLAHTGRTPPRAKYVDEGAFILKVGNLTGQGVDWSPRERNFVPPSAVAGSCRLEEGDIVLTSSAHNPRYIAQKVDVIWGVPEFVRSPTFVGEVMRLRVDPALCDPFDLLAFLRAPGTRESIQAMIRGQTAHLHPKDLLDLPLPDPLSSLALRDLLRREAEIAAELNDIAARQRTELRALAHSWPA